MANKIIRDFCKENGVYLWQFADLVGLSESWFYHYMKREFPENVQLNLVEAMKKAANGERPDLSVWKEYKARQEVLAQAKRNDCHKNRSQSISAWRKQNAALDEAEARRIKGGWDTWQ